MKKKAHNEKNNFKKINYKQKKRGNHLKLKKSVIFVKKSLKINIWKIKCIKKSLQRFWKTKFRKISYFQSNTLLLANVFENFQNMCLEIYELEPAKPLSAPGLAWQRALKKGYSKIRSFNWFNGICHSIYRYPKVNHKYIKHYFKNKESACLLYGM